VLTQAQAELHPLYATLVDHFYKHLPTVNPPLYERACYVRWLAMAVAGGGWMSDADVIPYSLYPFVPCSDTLTVFSQGNITPCLVYGSSSEYERVVRDIFLTHQKGVYAENHASDQDILQINAHKVRQVELVALYNTDGWKQSSVVHFNNDSMGCAQPRSELIPPLR
jgi:hypothetical protein